MEIQTNTHTVKRYHLEQFQVQYGTANIPTATVSLRKPNEEVITTACTGNGSVEALYKTIAELIEEETNLLDYQINSIGGGKDALAESYVKLNVNDEVMNGRGTATDVLAASANAYINAVNKYLIQQQTAAMKDESITVK